MRAGQFSKAFGCELPDDQIARFGEHPELVRFTGTDDKDGAAADFSIAKGSGRGPLDCTTGNVKTSQLPPLIKPINPTVEQEWLDIDGRQGSLPFVTPQHLGSRLIHRQFQHQVTVVIAGHEQMVPRVNRRHDNGAVVPLVFLGPELLSRFWINRIDGVRTGQDQLEAVPVRQISVPVSLFNATQ